jgi:hypothetical protein
MKWVVRMWIGFIWLWVEPNGGPSEHYNEPSGFIIEVGEFLTS